MQDSTTTTTGVDEVFVGVDWGGSHHQLCAVSRTGQRLRQVRLSHHVAGLQQLDTELNPLGQGHSRQGPGNLREPSAYPQELLCEGSVNDICSGCTHPSLSVS